MSEIPAGDLYKIIINLTESKDISRGINEALEFLRFIFSIDIISIFRIHKDSTQVLVNQDFRCNCKNHTVNPLLQNAPIEILTPGWLDRMKDGRIICEHVKNLSQPARTFFETINTATIVTIPIMQDDFMYGYLALNSYRERDWKDEELEVIKMFTGVIALVIYKNRLKEENTLLNIEGF